MRRVGLPRRARRSMGMVPAILVAAGVAGAGGPALVLAATNGAVGATSTGTTVITATIPDRVRVMGFTDISLGPYAGADLTGTSPACVSHNGPGSYGITLTSANGSFVLASTTQAATLRYSVAWGGRTIPYGRPSGAFTADNPTLASCTPVTDRLRVTIPAREMDVAPPGAYFDTLQIIVTPL